MYQISVGNDFDPATSLNEFLRDSRRSMGTKYMCREGGCGLCVVMATRYDPVTKENESVAINSVSFLYFLSQATSLS